MNAQIDSLIKKLTAGGFKKAWPRWLALACLIALVGEVAMMLYQDFVDPTALSNRSYALPAAHFALLSVCCTVYLSTRFPLWLRLLVSPMLLVFYYLAFGMVLIVLSGLIRKFSELVTP